MGAATIPCDEAVATPAAPAACEPGIDPHVAVGVYGLTKRFARRRTWAELLRSPFNNDQVTVVHDVTWTVAPGELFGLLGPNGAGKTTIFKMLAGATTPDGGTAVVHGRDVILETMAVRHSVGCVMANDRTLYWRLSAAENLRLFAALYGIYGRTAQQRIREVLRAVELSDAGNKLVANFSSGMRQRLLIARALLPRPRVLLLDEPTRSLDPLSARSFRAFLRNELVATGECTVLLATHSSEEAMDLCDRVAVLDRGRLLAQGTTRELSAQYGGEWYCIWTRDAEHPALLARAAEGYLRHLTITPSDASGWSCLRAQIPGGADRAAGILQSLARDGMRISRFESVQLTLADLLERIVDHAERT